MIETGGNTFLDDQIQLRKLQPLLITIHTIQLVLYTAITISHYYLRYRISVKT